MRRSPVSASAARISARQGLLEDVFVQVSHDLLQPRVFIPSSFNR